MSLAKEFEDFASEVGDELNRINRGIGTRTVSEKLSTDSKTVVGAINELNQSVTDLTEEVGKQEIDFTASFMEEVNRPDPEDEGFFDDDEEEQPPRPPVRKPPRPRF